MTRKHKCDFKFVGANRKVAQFGNSRVSGRHYECRTCGAYQIKADAPKREKVEA